MLVCHCKAVFDRQIREAIARGARDEFDVAAVCGAGSDCGGCVESVTRILTEELCAPGCPVTGALRDGGSQRAARVDVVPPTA